LAAQIGHYFKQGEKVSPYGSLGIGTIYNRSRVDVGVYTFEVDAWHFLLRPEIGVFLKTNSDMNIILASKYYYGFDAGDNKAVSYFTFNIGFSGLW